nr:hypothetical protein GCM10023233_20360 [Brevibacterium otitidis]
MRGYAVRQAPEGSPAPAAQMLRRMLPAAAVSVTRFLVIAVAVRVGLPGGGGVLG